MGFSFKKIGKKVTDNYYILVLSINFAFMFNFDIHLGVLVTTISLLYGIKLSSIKSSSPLIKNIVILFILFNLLSGILYVSNRLPISVYFDEIKMQMLPIFFFFIGNNSKDTDNYFYKGALIGASFLFIIGIYLYFTMPYWYVNWKQNALFDWLGDVNKNYITSISGLSSFYSTPYNTGYLSVIVLAIVLSYLYRIGLKITYVVLFLMSLIVLILAQQRVCWVVGVAILVFYTIYGLINKQKVSYYILFLLILFFCFGIYYFSIHKDYYYILDAVFTRFNSLDSAVSERTELWGINANNTIFDYLFGHGLGVRSHAAAALGFPSNTDGNYFKFLNEIGIIGLFLLLCIIISTFYRSLLYYKYLSIELAITFFFPIACIGADPFSMPILICMYWFCVGRVWNRPYLQLLIKTNDYLK